MRWKSLDFGSFPRVLILACLLFQTPPSRLLFPRACCFEKDNITALLHDEIFDIFLQVDVINRLPTLPVTVKVLTCPRSVVEPLNGPAFFLDIAPRIRRTCLWQAELPFLFILSSAPHSGSYAVAESRAKLSEIGSYHLEETCVGFVCSLLRFSSLSSDSFLYFSPGYRRLSPHMSGGALTLFYLSTCAFQKLSFFFSSPKFDLVPIPPLFLQDGSVPLVERSCVRCPPKGFLFTKVALLNYEDRLSFVRLLSSISPPLSKCLNALGAAMPALPAATSIGCCAIAPPIQLFLLLSCPIS